MRASRKLELVCYDRENKELVKWRGMSFRESQHGIVFNPWLCGSPGMPSLLLLPPPQRRGIKDTLHLFFDRVRLLRIFISLNFAENYRLRFRVSELGYFCILFMALYGGFFVFIERFYSYAERMYYYYHYYYYMSALAITKSMIIIIIKNSTKLLRFYEVPKHEMQKCFAEYYEE